MFPPELWDHIAFYVANSDRMRLGCTCKQLRHLTQDHQCWTAPGAQLRCLPQLRVLHGIPAECSGPTPPLAGQNYMHWRTLQWKCLIHVPYLRELNLAHSGIDDLDMCGIAEFTPQLQVLNVAGTHVKCTHWLVPVTKRPHQPTDLLVDTPSDDDSPASPALPLWPQLQHLTLGCRDARYVFSRTVGIHVPALTHLSVEAADVEYYRLDAFPRLTYLRMDGLQAELAGGGNLTHLCTLFLTQANFLRLPLSLQHLRCGPVPGPNDIHHPGWDRLRAGQLPLPQFPRLLELVVL